MNVLVATFAGLLIAAQALGAAPIENELVLITPVGKSLSDPALAEFRRHARERWGIEVRTSALSAGTPVAYGRWSSGRGGRRPISSGAAKARSSTGSRRRSCSRRSGCPRR
jgi:hypothetical protein